MTQKPTDNEVTQAECECLCMRTLHVVPEVSPLYGVTILPL